MARAFRRRGSGDGARFVAELDADEREVVASLMAQVRDLLEPSRAVDEGGDEFAGIVAGLGIGRSAPLAGRRDPEGADASTGEDSEVPERDPALDRLLPTGNREDDEAASEFRRLTETGLRHRKALVLDRAVASLHGDDRVTLDEVGARGFVTALTDVRLVLGERLQLRTDEDLDLLEELARSLDPEDPVVHVVALYDFLTWLQESLASALLGD
jgi:hypothetical protein